VVALAAHQIVVVLDGHRNLVVVAVEDGTNMALVVLVHLAKDMPVEILERLFLTAVAVAVLVALVVTLMRAVVQLVALVFNPV
jgi:hypothetical protein